MARQHRFAARAEAESEMQAWRKELPAAESAYRPSGALPQDAIRWLTGGAVLGSFAGAAAGIAAGAVVIGASAGLLSFLSQYEGLSGALWVALAAVVLFLVAFLGMFMGAGIVAGHITFLAGKRGNNRSPFAGVVLAVVSSLLALAPLWVIMSGAPQYLPRGRAKQALSSVFGAGGLGIFCMIAAAVTAAAAAGRHVNKRIKAAKFCEECERFMAANKPWPISYAGVKEAALLLGNGLTAGAAAKPLSAVPDSHQEASVELFHCPRCRAGYIEIMITFAAEWPKPGTAARTRHLTKTWMCVSQALPSGVADVLAKAAAQKPAETAQEQAAG